MYLHVTILVLSARAVLPFHSASRCEVVLPQAVVTHSAGGVAGLESGATTRPEGKIRTATENDRGERINLAVGEELRIVLPSQLGTGQVWKLSTEDLKALKLKEGYPKYEREPGKPGARQTVVFRFDVVRPGSEEIHLRQGRPDKQASSTYEITIMVNH